MNRSDVSRNVFMLKGPLAKNGYDWWWHNFTGYNRSTGEPKSFFIEYFVCNPLLGADRPVLGQHPDNIKKNIKPSYALIKVGYWGREGQQIHNFYPINDFKYNPEKLDIKIGDCVLTETRMEGQCELSKGDSLSHPEYMSGWGAMKWKLEINKKIPFNVGYGASRFIRSLNAFEMFWHAEGIKTEYSGIVELNNEIFDIIPEKSYGYSDKNWGRDYTSPWLWISSCNLKSRITGKELTNSAIELGGGNPKVYGISLGRKILGCMCYEGKVYEYNFSKFWKRSKIEFQFGESNDKNSWFVEAVNKTSKIEVSIECKKEEMIFINYEAPNGKKLHNRLWNGGTGYGTIKVYEKEKNKYRLIDDIIVSNTGCEYGEYE